MATAMRKANSEETDSELADGAEQLGKDAKPADKGSFDKIKTRLREKAESRGVELPDGCAVSATAARFLREREGSEYIGTAFEKFAKEADGRGDGERWVPFVPSKHAGLATKLVVTEYLLAPASSSDVNVPAYVTPSSGLLIWRVCGGKLEGPFGRTLATSCLQRMANHGLLSAVGERLLSEQTGTPKPASEESAAEVVTK